MNLIFGKKLILKYFMHRTIPKKCVLEYFEPPNTFLRSILLEEAPSYILTSFYRYNVFGCIYILLTHTKKTKIFHSPTLLFWVYVLEWYFSRFLQKNLETFISTWILFFHFPVKLVLPTYGPFSWSALHLPVSLCTLASASNMILIQRSGLLRQKLKFFSFYGVKRSV